MQNGGRISATNFCIDETDSLAAVSTVIAQHSNIITSISYLQSAKPSHISIFTSAESSSFGRCFTTIKSDIIDCSQNVIEFQVRYCTACRHNQEVNVRFLKLYWQKIFTQSLANDATACYWLQSLEVSEPRLQTLRGARGDVSADELHYVTMYESSLIYMLNNDKLICKFLSDYS